MDEEEIVVTLPTDTSVVTVTKTDDGARKPAPKAGAPADEAVTDLKNQFAAMTARVTTAETAARVATEQATEATQRASRMETQVVTSQLDTVLTGIAAAESEANAAEIALANAIEAGDAPAQARANRAIASATSRIERLTEAKADLEDAVKRGPATRPTPQQNTRTAPPSDPVEAFTQGMSPRSAAWVKAHPECVTDRRMNARMLAAHNLALADDVEVDSDEYFRRIEDGIGGSQVQKTAAKPSSDTGRRPSSAAASGAGASGGLNGGDLEVRLTKREAASATDGTLVWNYDDPTGQKRWTKGEPIGLKEMARRKHEGMKSGLYDRMQYEA